MKRTRIDGEEHRVGALAPRQREILQLLIRHFDFTGEAPSARYLARRLGLHLKTVQEHLAALYRKGYLSSPSTNGLRCRHAEQLSPDGSA